jgi:P-type Ca2+ transporter type 2C
MRALTDSPEKYKGLSSSAIPVLRQQYGENKFEKGHQRRLWHILWDIAKEPMFLLLLAACTLYFILGKTSEGMMMLAAILFVAAISVYQEVKSNNAVNALKEFTQPRITVIRDGIEIDVATEELVPGDHVLIEEGMNMPADAIVLQANDFSVNESVITGESLPVSKHEAEGENNLFQGTLVNSGKCVAKITATGNNTVLGKLGKAVGAYQPPKTLLQAQLNRFVRIFGIFGLVGFLVILLVNYLQHGDWAVSLLFALTLAMSAVPEEIPVAFSSFMALGAYKMSKLGIISRQPLIVENLGAVNVLCFDKTGTLTENKMEVKSVYDHRSKQLTELTKGSYPANENILRIAMLASETSPFDSMEKAIHEAYDLYTKKSGNENLPVMVHEYPLAGHPPMMTHVYKSGNTITVTSKGAAERILSVCKLSNEEKNAVSLHIQEMGAKGYRVLGVASADHTGETYPGQQDDFDWRFEGLLALYDPPKKNVTQVVRDIYAAKISIKLITGDHPQTAMNIAAQCGIKDATHFLTGENIMSLNATDLISAVHNTTVFARMFPDAKLKVINALKENGEIAGMTGDGVNDGPALKAASIGIAMGQKGTGIARQAADLIITDDNLEKIVIAVREGRKIFNNLKKAVRYIISIHIPIILTASLPLVLGWKYPNIFTPVHIIFLELIMGPTCSVFYEREPVESQIMQLHPRNRKKGLFTTKELLISVIQGLIIAAGVLLLYFFFMMNGATTEKTRTIVFSTLLLSNVFLTFANRSFTETMYHTWRYKNKLAPLLLLISAIFLALMHGVPAVRNLFGLSLISMREFFLCTGVALISVLWFELYKLITLARTKK